MHKHVNILKIYTVCVYLHIHNKYTQYIYNVNKNFLFCMRLIAIKLEQFLFYFYIRLACLLLINFLCISFVCAWNPWSCCSSWPSGTLYNIYNVHKIASQWGNVKITLNYEPDQYLPVLADIIHIYLGVWSLTVHYCSIYAKPFFASLLLAVIFHPVAYFHHHRCSWQR